MVCSHTESNEQEARRKPSGRDPSSVPTHQRDQPEASEKDQDVSESAVQSRPREVTRATAPIRVQRRLENLPRQVQSEAPEDEPQFRSLCQRLRARLESFHEKTTPLSRDFRDFR